MRRTNRLSWLLLGEFKHVLEILKALLKKGVAILRGVLFGVVSCIGMKVLHDG